MLCMSRPKGSAIKARRLKLGLSKEAIARAAGVSVITYKKVEDDKSVRDTSLAMVLEALEREEGRRSGDATVHATVATSAAGRVDRWAQPAWMSDATYRRIMRDMEDYFHYKVSVVAEDYDDAELRGGVTIAKTSDAPLERLRRGARRPSPGRSANR